MWLRYVQWYWRYNIYSFSSSWAPSGLPIWIRSVRETAPLRLRRESIGALHTSLVYNFIVVWVVLNNFCFLLWLFAITIMSSFWLYLFVGIALLTCSKTWPVGIDHCSVCYYFYGNVLIYAADLLHYLDVRNATLKLVPNRTCCEAYIDVKLSLIWFSQWSAYIIIHLNTLYQYNNLIKTRLHPLSKECSASPVFTSSGLVWQ